MNRLGRKLAWLGLLAAVALGGCRKAEPYRPRPLPNGPSSLCQWKLEKVAQAYYRKLYLDSYAAHGKHDAPYDAAARRYLAAVVQALATDGREPGLARLDRLADDVLKHEVDDPLLCGLLGQRLWDRQDYRAGQMMRQALEGQASSPYPVATQWEVPLDLAALTLGVWPAKQGGKAKAGRRMPAKPSTEPRKVAEAQRLERLGEDLLARALAQPVGDALEKRLLWRRMAFNVRLHDRDLGPLLARLQGDKRVDPWYAHLLLGMYPPKEWQPAKGTGFGTYLSEARRRNRRLEEINRELRAAWTLHPEFPEAAGYLMSVAWRRPTGDKDAVRRWFDWAVAAQFDYQPAYAIWLRVLAAEDADARDKLLAFGRECLATRRFDTVVTYQYLAAVYQVARALGEEHIWQDTKVQADLDRLFAGELKEPRNRPHLDEMRLLYAGLKCRGRKYAEAYRILGQVSPKTSAAYAAMWLSADAKTLAGEIAALGGPKAEAAQAAEKVLRQHDYPRAVKLFKQAAKADTDPRAKAWYEARIKECKTGGPPGAPTKR